MSMSALDRWIAAGRVQIRKETHGQRHRVFVMDNAAMGDGNDIASGCPRGVWPSVANFDLVTSKSLISAL